MKINVNVKEQNTNMKDRLEICKKCPICDLDNMICKPNLYLNPETNEASVVPMKGFIKGCGCALLFKTKNLNKHCPANKW